MGKTFLEDKRVGTVGEFVTWDYLQRMKGVRSVVDVRDDSFFQSMDVDFLMEWDNRQFYWVEVKTDRQAQNTGNIVFEIKTEKDEGCLQRSRAHYIAYYIPAQGDLYIMDAKKLKEYALSGTHKVFPIGDNSFGHLLPIKELEEKGIILNIEQVIALDLQK